MPQAPLVISVNVQPIAHRLSSAPCNPWPDRPVPIALTITELDVGGAERALVALATGLDRRQWAPAVVGLGPEGPLALPLRQAGIPTSCLDVNRRRPLRAIAKLAATLSETRPVLVQSFLFHANVASRLAARRLPTPRPWVVGGLRVAEHQQGWHRRLDRLTVGLSAGSVCVSEGVRRFSVEVGGLAADRLVVIPNGVDPSPFDRATPADREALGVPASSPLALFVGRLHRQKGVDVLLEAMSLVVAQRPETHLLIVGDGPDREALRDQADASPALAANVHWFGRRDDVPSLLKAADLLVLPSRWEGMPNVVLEAMASRRAVVATAVEGSAELVEPGRTGWLVPPGDPDKLAAALLDALSDPDRLRRMGEAGRDRVEAEFTPARVVAAYERLWAGLIGLDLATAPGDRP